MKKIILLTALFVSGIFPGTVHSQTIDSISVNLTKVKNSEDSPWSFSALNIDSFSNSLLISTLVQEWNNQWENSEYYHRSYSSSTLVQQLLQTYVNSQWVDNTRWSYYYSAAVDSVLRQLWNAGWDNDSMTTIYHDINSLDSVIIYQKWNAASWQNISRVEFTYDSSFNQQSVTYANWNTGQSQWIYTYRYVHVDSLGGTVEQSYGAGNWGNLTLYYDFGPAYGWDSADSSFSIVYGTGFTDHDSLGRVIHVYFNGLPGGYSESYYIYDSNGALVYEFSHDETMGGIMHEEIKRCIYFTFPGSAIYSFAANDTISMCRGDSTLIQFFAFGGTPPLNLHWSPGTAVSNDSIGSPYAIADSTTNLVATIVDSTGNFIRDSVFVRVNPIPYISSIQSIPTCPGCSTGVFIFTISGAPGNTYYNVEPFIFPGVTYGNDTVSGLPAGVYTICVYDDNHCNSCISDSIFESPVIVNEMNGDEINLFPNPFESQTIIHVPSSESNVLLEWTDLSGRFVRDDRLLSGNNLLLKNNLPNGSYVGILMSGGKIIGRIKIVVLE